MSAIYNLCFGNLTAANFFYSSDLEYMQLNVMTYYQHTPVITALELVFNIHTHARSATSNLKIVSFFSVNTDQLIYVNNNIKITRTFFTLHFSSQEHKTRYTKL